MNHPVNSDLQKKLIQAAEDGNLAVLREHVSQLPSVRDNDWNRSVLHWSAYYGHFEYVDFISRTSTHAYDAHAGQWWMDSGSPSLCLSLGSSLYSFSSH